LLYVDGGPSTTGTVGKLRMKGREVFRHAVVNLSSVLGEVLGEVGLGAQDIDWLVPHQANARILEATAKTVDARRKGGDDGGRPCQHLGSFRAPGAGYGGARRAHQARPSGDARGDGRRFHLGASLLRV
jgi:hypothetical protein